MPVCVGSSRITTAMALLGIDVMIGTLYICIAPGKPANTTLADPFDSSFFCAGAPSFALNVSAFVSKGEVFLRLHRKVEMFYIRDVS